MNDWSVLVSEWKAIGGIGTVVAAILAGVRILRSSSHDQPPLWQRLFQVGSAWVRLQIADEEIEYLKKTLQSVRSERFTLLEDCDRKDTEILRLRLLINGDSGVDSSAGSTSRRGENTRKKRTTFGTSEGTTP